MRRESRSPQRRRESRSPGRIRDSQHWVPVAPCTIHENVTLEKCSKMMVTVAPKGEFSFRENKGCMVRITKWTGREYVGSIHIKHQVVTLDDNLDLQIEVENPYPEKDIPLFRHDKIACLSILSSPIPSSLFSSVSSGSPDRYESDSRRWFKVTTVLLHKKGIKVHLLGCNGCYITIICIAIWCVALSSSSITGENCSPNLIIRDSSTNSYLSYFRSTWADNNLSWQNNEDYWDSDWSTQEICG